MAQPPPFYTRTSLLQHIRIGTSSTRYIKTKPRTTSTPSLLIHFDDEEEIRSVYLYSGSAQMAPVKIQFILLAIVVFSLTVSTCKS